MKKRIAALILMICITFSMIPAPAETEQDVCVESGMYEPEIPLEAEDSGVEGLFVDSGDEEAPEEVQTPEEGQEILNEVRNDVPALPDSMEEDLVESEETLVLSTDGASSTFNPDLQEEVCLEDVVTEDAVLEETISGEVCLEDVVIEGAVPEETISEEVCLEEICTEEVFPEDACSEEDLTEYTGAIELPMVFSTAFRSGAISAIRLNRNDVSLVERGVYDLSAVYDDGSKCSVVWQTENPAVAVVDEKGHVTAVGCGETQVIASDENGLTAACIVKVSESATSIAFDCDTFYLGAGETSGEFGVIVNDGSVSPLDGYTLVSDNPYYVRVNADGTLTGLRKGAAVVTAMTEGGLADTMQVIVKNAPAKIVASPKSFVIGLNESVQLGYKLTSGSFGRVKYSVYTGSSVSVDEKTGVLTGIALGDATVIISTYNNKGCAVKVKVVNAPESITLSAVDVVMGAGVSGNLTASIPKGSASRIYWESDNAEVASVNNGRVTTIAPGTAVITARTYVEGLQAQCTVNVKEAPKAVTLPYKKLYIGIGEKVKLTPDVGDSVGGFRYSSSKSQYATVSSSGIVKGKKKGSTTITVKTYNGKKTTLKVVVGNAPKKIKAYGATLGLGETGKIAYKLTAGSYSAVTFTSQNPECVSVDPNTGAIKALKTGSAVIQLQTFNKKRAYALVQVLEAPTGINFSPEQMIIGAGQKLPIAASVNEGAAGVVTMESADTAVAAVKSGVVTGIAPGKTEIIARTYVEGVENACHVLVKPAPAKITLPAKKVYIGVGDYYLIQPDVGDSVGGYTYYSNNKKCAKVYAGGTVAGKKAGTAKITVSTYNGKKATLTVYVLKAPSKIYARTGNLELGVGETYKLGYTLPKNTFASVAFTSTDESILKVDEKTGEVTALKTGEAKVRMRTHNGKEAYTTIKVYPAPEWLEVNAQNLDMGVGQKFSIRATIPDGSRSAIRFTSTDGSVAQVSADGVVTALKKGNANIRVETCNKDACADIAVQVWDAPSTVSLKQTAIELNVDEKLKIEPVIPEGTKAGYIFKSSNAALAAVSEDGTVTTRVRGEVTITVTTHNGKSAALKLKINDPWYPESVTLTNMPGVMWAGGEAYQLLYTVSPENARPLLKWTSSNPKVAAVDGNGLVKPLSYGYTTISAVSEKNSNAKIQFALVVQDEKRILEIPERTTTESGISGNLAKIEAIRKAAIAQVDALRANGAIKSSDASKRKSMINNIFRDYAFPWKTPSLQKYWKKANSENGAKDFKTDRVYYGMPYISGSGTNRIYNVTKALQESRYTDSGNGYYLLNRSNLLNGKYVGSDCSGLVNTAIWGTASSHTDDRTVEIGQSKAYKTIKSFNSMRPGDLICLDYNHVVMFLYYANPEKTKIMIIENGGAEAGTNTVHCAVHNVSYYTKRKYKVRRLASLG